MTAVAMGATPEGVDAVVNFAGGTGGNPSIAPTGSCTPDRMTELYAKLCANSRTPGLWIYVRNDLFAFLRTLGLQLARERVDSGQLQPS